MWVPAESRTEDGYYWLEGWYELFDDGGEYSAALITDGEIIKWQPQS
jgi:hypothetical protein